MPAIIKAADRQDTSAPSLKKCLFAAVSNKNSFPETCESFPQNQYLYVYVLLFSNHRCICIYLYMPILFCKIVVIKPDTLPFGLLTDEIFIVGCIFGLPSESAFFGAFRSGLESFTFCFEMFEYVRIFPSFCNRKACKARRARGARWR